MSASRPRPVMTTLVMAAILLFGLMGYRQLPVSDLPTVDYPTITVSAALSGASPETMAASVATPLEKSFSTMALFSGCQGVAWMRTVPFSRVASRRTLLS